MMLLIGESSMSHAHLVNGAVVNVRARVRLILSFFRDDRFWQSCLWYLSLSLFHWKILSMPNSPQGDKLGVWLADAREEEGVLCHNHNHCYLPQKEICIFECSLRFNHNHNKKDDDTRRHTHLELNHLSVWALLLSATIMSMLLIGYGYWSDDQVSPGDRRYIYYIDISPIHWYISLMHNYHKSIYRRTHQDPVPRSQGGEGQGNSQDSHIMEIWIWRYFLEIYIYRDWRVFIEYPISPKIISSPSSLD